MTNQLLPRPVTTVTLPTDQLTPALLSFPTAAAKARESAERLRKMADRYAARGLEGQAEMLRDEAAIYEKAANELQGTRPTPTALPSSTRGPLTAALVTFLAMLLMIGSALAQAPTTPMAAGEEPLTEEQREAMAAMKLAPVINALDDSAQMKRIAVRVGWTLGILFIVVAGWAVLGGTALDGSEEEDTDPAYDADDFRASREWCHRRNGNRLHIHRLSEEPMKLPK